MGYRGDVGLSSVRGAPRYLRSDNAAEFVSVTLLKWDVEHRFVSALIDPCKQRKNGTTESFNGKFRGEGLAMEWFQNHLEAKVVIDNWRQNYNTVRAHLSLQYETPETFARKQSKALLICSNLSYSKWVGSKKLVRSPPQSANMH